METYTVEVEFWNGTTVEIEVEAKNEDEALDLAMPKSTRIR
ncbi:hypothetical protein [Bacillus sp. T33-2]|nr:hypothetical protein [Bacillus sp. T33-2]